VVKLVAAFAFGLDQASGLQNVEVLRDRLARGAELVLGRQPRTDLKQGLSVALGQAVEDPPTGGIGKRLEDVAHAGDNRQVNPCMSNRVP
jgi:hypothetical protein